MGESRELVGAADNEFFLSQGRMKIGYFSIGLGQLTNPEWVRGGRDHRRARGLLDPVDGDKQEVRHKLLPRTNLAALLRVRYLATHR
jgi:hypothetical protein